MATVIHITKTVPVTDDSAERILTEFDTALLPDSVSNQLERVLRDLRGLPPQISEPAPVTENIEAESKEAE